MRTVPHKSGHKLRVAVLMGGPSAEHGVSLKSGMNVMRNLDKEKYSSRGVIISSEGKWPMDPADLLKVADVAFVAMHGIYGEDGGVQSILDKIGIPYTGSGAKESALAMNKFLTLRFLGDLRMIVPLTRFFSKSQWVKDSEMVVKAIELYIHYPVVLKPNRYGSSFGVSIVRNPNNLRGALGRIFEDSRDIIAEPFIKGREFTCAVLDHGSFRTAYALPPTEIIPLKGEFFDYDAKYSPDSSIEVTPARISEVWLNIIRRTAVYVHNALGCRGMSRTDMILGSDGKLYFLEINTIPGMTEASLLPKAVAAYGMSFSEMLDRIINSAFLSYYSRA